MKLPVPVRPQARTFTMALQARLDRPQCCATTRISRSRGPKSAMPPCGGDEPPLTGLKMIDALAVSAVARAVLGSDLMMAQVADRIEGRPAMRSGESDVDE